MQILEKVYHSLKIRFCALHFAGQENCTRSKSSVQPNHMASMTKGFGTLNSISCKKTNIYGLFNKQTNRKRSHKKRRYNKRAPQPDVAMSTLVDLANMIEKPEGVHNNINTTKLFSISFQQLSTLQELALEPINKL